MRPTPAARCGFTNLELLWVLVIMLILGAILFSPVRTFYLNNQKNRCAANLKTLGDALRLYALDHDGEYPMSRMPIDPADPDKGVFGYWENDPFVTDPPAGAPNYGRAGYAQANRAILGYLPRAQDVAAFFCPSSAVSFPGPDGTDLFGTLEGAVAGATSYRWMANWVFSDGRAEPAAFADRGRVLRDPLFEAAEGSRLLLGEEPGMSGWFDRLSRRNHPDGYNVLLNDGSVRYIFYGGRNDTNPPTGWFDPDGEPRG